MNARELARAVALMEGGWEEEHIANTAETLKCANKLVCGALYRAARAIPAPDFRALNAAKKTKKK